MEDVSSKFQIGRVNRLSVCSKAPQGVYLKALDHEILLPQKQVPADVEVGDELEVFIYTDSEDRLIATVNRPLVQWDQVASLEVKETTHFGAFLDWGLEKDLLIPDNEQINKLREGDKVVVLVCLDEESDRLYASTRLRDFFYAECFEYERGQEVEYIVHEFNEHGAQVIVDQSYRGMIYKDDLTKELEVGNSGIAYLKTKKKMGSLSFVSKNLGLEGVIEIKPILLQRLRQNHGFLPLNDASSPDEIRSVLNISKKVFKKAIGSLYKEGKINLEADGIRLKSNPKSNLIKLEKRQAFSYS